MTVSILSVKFHNAYKSTCKLVERRNFSMWQKNMNMPFVESRTSFQQNNLSIYIAVAKRPGVNQLFFRIVF